MGDSNVNVGDFVLLHARFIGAVIDHRVYVVTKVSNTRVYITVACENSEADLPKERYVNLRTIKCVCPDYKVASIAVEKCLIQYEKLKKYKAETMDAYAKILELCSK